MHSQEHVRYLTSKFLEWPPGEISPDFPNKNAQDFSPEIMEKNQAKMEKHLDMTLLDVEAFCHIHVVWISVIKNHLNV
jgi:hypothetical protein